MSSAALKPNYKAILQYYEMLKTFHEQNVKHEGAVESAFSRLLTDTAKPRGWLLLPKLKLKVGGKTIYPDR